MRINEVKQVYREKLRAVREEYRGALSKLIIDEGLDGTVVRGDGKEGVIRVAENYDGLMYEIKFYPITQKGTVSQKADSYVDGWSDLSAHFRPKESED